LRNEPSNLHLLASLVIIAISLIGSPAIANADSACSVRPMPEALVGTQIEVDTPASIEHAPQGSSPKDSTCNYHKIDRLESLDRSTDSLPLWAEWITWIASIATIFALGWAVFTWRRNIYVNKISQINSLLQELRHNLSISENIFFKTASESESMYLYERLDELDDLSIYPNPSDCLEPEKHFLRKNTFIWRIPAHPRSPLYFISLEEQAKSRVLESGAAVGLIGDRIILNLGHLHYSVIRHNNNISSFNAEANTLPRDTAMPSQFDYVYNEYMTWTHYRLYFLMLDLIDSVPIKYFIDKQFVIKELIKGDRISKKKLLKKKHLGIKSLSQVIEPPQPN